MATIQEGMARYLTACRHDIAHLTGESEQALAAWVVANLAEALVRYNDALQAGTEDAEEAAGVAQVAVKTWAQGAHYHEPQPT